MLVSPIMNPFKLVKCVALATFFLAMAFSFNGYLSWLRYRSNLLSVALLEYSLYISWLGCLLFQLYTLADKLEEKEKD